MSIIYLLFKSGAISSEDTGYLFAIEFFFAAVLIAMYLAKKEIDHCCPSSTLNEIDQINSPLIF